MSLDAASTAASEAGGGGDVVLTYPLEARSLNDVDPRFAGQGTDIVWYARVIKGAPDPNGTAEGVDVLIDDATGSVVGTMPLAVDRGYEPARLVLDTNGQVPGPLGRAEYLIDAGQKSLARGWLDSTSVPLVLEPGEYTVRALGFTGAINQPPTRPGCSTELALAAGDDIAYYAAWPGGADCTWKEGEWPFE